VHINCIERVRRKFVEYAFRGLEWMDIYDLPPNVDRCALICLETLTRRRSDAIFFFDSVSGRVGWLNLLSLFNVISPRCRIHRSNYGVHEPFNDVVWHLMKGLVCSIFLFVAQARFFSVVSVYLRFELLFRKLYNKIQFFWNLVGQNFFGHIFKSLYRLEWKTKIVSETF
jgi:hypothetical protein